MAGSVNKVILVGNLGRDPEVRTFQNGGKVCNLRIATSERWKDRNSGEQRERTEWHSVAIFSEPLARTAEQYLRKGSKVYLEGQLETRSIMVMLDGRSGGGGGDYGGDDRGGSYGGGGDYGGSSGGGRAPASNDLDDEIPF